jgi:RNA polymerase sigma-70 factor, ECF subfamily
MTDHAMARTEDILASSIQTSDDVELDARFTRLYESAVPRVYSFVRSQVPTVDVAQEIVSRVFMKVYRHRAKVPTDGTEMIWVFRIARTTLIDYRRTDGRRQVVTVSATEMADAPDPVPNQESSYAARESAALLLRVLGTLGDDDRMLIALKFAGQRTNREIAAILGLSDAAVSMRLLRTLRRLRDRLAEMGLR